MSVDLTGGLDLPVSKLLFTQRWQDLETLLDNCAGELLTKEMDGLLAVIHYAFRNSRQFQERIAAARLCLDEARCDRHDGVDRMLSTYFRIAFNEGGAYHGVVKPGHPETPQLFNDPTQQLVLEVTSAFMMSSSWWERIHICAAYRTLFVSGDVEGMLLGLETRTEESALRHLYSQLRSTLQRGQVVGFEEVLADGPLDAFMTQDQRENPALTFAEWRQLALIEFIECPAWERRREILRRNEELLLSDGLEQALNTCVQRAPDSLHMAITSALGVLRTAQREGIQTAFHGSLPAIGFKIWRADRALFETAEDPALPFERSSYLRSRMHATDRSLAPWLWAAANSLLSRSLIELGDTQLNPVFAEEALLRSYNALEVFTHENAIDEWSDEHEHLGRVYRHRRRGSRLANLESAIRSLEGALHVHQKRGLPHKAARLEGRLTEAFAQRLKDAPALNFEKAYNHGIAALKFYAGEQSRIGVVWISTLLAGVLLKSVMRDDSRKVEEAIELLTSALARISQKDDPRLWASAHHLLGDAYIRHSSSATENYDKATHHLYESRRVFRREKLPWYWALTEAQLGAAAFRFRRSDASAQAAAVEHYRNALTVFDGALFPFDRQRTLRELGALLFAQGEWAAAACVLDEALKLGKYLQDEAHSPDGRLVEIAELPDVYERLAFCLLRLDRPASAFRALDVGKARLLRAALPGVGSLGLTPELQTALDNATEGLRKPELRAPRSPQLKGEDPSLEHSIAVQAVHGTARQRLNAAKNVIDDTQLGAFGHALFPDQLPMLVPDGGALVAPLFTSQGAVIFVVTRDAGNNVQDVVALNGVTDGDLRDLLDGTSDRPGWFEIYGRWHRALHALQQAEATRESRVGVQALRTALPEYDAATNEWQRTIDHTCRVLWDLLVGPIHTELAGRVRKHARVVFLPSKWLSILPLHAAWREANWGRRRYFVDDYVVSYAPSCLALAASRRRLHDRGAGPATLLALANPTGDLHYAAAEAKSIAATFPRGSSRVLVGSEASSANLIAATQNQSHLHFACHAAFNWLDARSSGLTLAGGIPYTIHDIAADLSLDTARLVTLSACESGVTEFAEVPNEFLGFPAAFIQAGAIGVISSLWAVDDEATGFLMRRFYKRHVSKRRMPAESLREAQLAVKGRAKTAHPYYWAAFTAVGE